MWRNITVTALSASTLTFSTTPGARGEYLREGLPRPGLERMLRFPQISSCTMRALPSARETHLLHRIPGAEQA